MIQLKQLLIQQIKNNLKEYFKIIAELTKIRITLFVMLTTVLGYVLAVESIPPAIIWPALGLLLFACGSAVINHIQERKTDALMDRTKNRPLPSGKITLLHAIYLTILLLFLGFIILLFSGGYKAVLLALLNLLWYNLLYTPLKKRTPLAIIPGSFVGAIPPAVGWVCGGGELLDPRILIISFFFFIWQIPHFWLLLLVLNKDYEKAGFPTLTHIFSKEQLSRITFMWITATACTSFLFPLFGILKNPLMIAPIIISGLLLTYKASNLLKDNKPYFRLAFRQINIFAILLVFFLSIDQLIII